MTPAAPSSSGRSGRTPSPRNKSAAASPPPKRRSARSAVLAPRRRGWWRRRPRPGEPVRSRARHREEYETQQSAGSADQCAGHNDALKKLDERARQEQLASGATTPRKVSNSAGSRRCQRGASSHRQGFSSRARTTSRPAGSKSGSGLPAQSAAGPRGRARRQAAQQALDRATSRRRCGARRPIRVGSDARLAPNDFARRQPVAACSPRSPRDGSARSPRRPIA